MRLINTKAHAIVDYLLGLALLMSNWVFDFHGEQPATAVSFCGGSFIVLLALCTKFELGYFKLIPLQQHLAIDVATGVLLAACPWLFSFSEEAMKPHLTFGLSIAAVALLTDRMLWAHHSHRERERRQQIS